MIIIFKIFKYIFFNKFYFKFKINKKIILKKRKSV